MAIIHMLSALPAALLWLPFCLSQQSDPTQFNGGSILAMAGRNSVAIAIDARFGLGFQTIATANSDSDSFSGGTHSRIMLLPDSNTLMAWTGLYGDGISFAEEMNVLLTRKMRKNSCMDFDATAKKKMGPRAIALFMSHLLYRKRNAPYYVEPVIVGLESISVPSEDAEVAANSDHKLNINSLQQLQTIATLDYNQQISQITGQPVSTSTKSIRYKTIQRPYLCTTDMLGAKSTSSTFVCSGVASRSLHGTAEALWRPDLDAEDLVEVCGKAFVSALERDCLSGYGVVVYLIQSHETESDDASKNISIKEYVVACRND